MDRSYAFVEMDSSSKTRWTVFTIDGDDVVGIDSTCGSFSEIVKKYGPIPAMPLPEERTLKIGPARVIK